MIKGKRELKSSVPAGKNKKAKNDDSPLKSDNNSIIKRRVKCITSPRCKNIDLKEKVKPNNTENQQTSENFNVSVEHNNNSYECQSERLNLILKESLHCSTLTQNELRILFMKYKSDGHFEANKNLPSFTALLDNQENTINYEDCFHNEATHTPTVDTQYLNYRDDKDTFDKSYYNNANESEQNFKYNACKHQENRTNEMYNIKENYFPSSSENVQYILPEILDSFECENNTYNARYDHFQNISESPQKYDNATQYFDQNYFHGRDWDSNMTLPNRNDNYQLWRSENSDCIPETNNSERQYNIKDHLEQHDWHMHSPNTNYSPTNNEYTDTNVTTINYNNRLHQDIDTNLSASSAASNNFPDSTSFLSSFTNVIDYCF